MRKLGIQLTGIPAAFPATRVKVQDKPMREMKKNNPFSFLAQKKEVRNLLEINKNLRGACTHPAAIISFDTVPGQKANRRQYPVPEKQKPVIDAQIVTWQGERHICQADGEANLEWNIPLLVVPKLRLDGSIKGWRVCLDPRMVNTIMKGSAYPQPLIEDVLSRLRGAAIFTKIDLRQGFHQFRVRPEDRHKTSDHWKVQGRRQ
jgi:hypothetical protein